MEKGIVKGSGKRDTWHDLVKSMRLTERLSVYLLTCIAHLAKKY